MALRRSERIISMAQQGQTSYTWEAQRAVQSQIFLVPKHESTKGCTIFQQELAIRGFQQVADEINIHILKTTLENEIQSVKAQKMTLENAKSVEELVVGLEEKYLQNKKEYMEDVKKSCPNNTKCHSLSQSNFTNPTVDVKSATNFELNTEQNELTSYDFNREMIEGNTSIGRSNKTNISQENLHKRTNDSGNSLTTELDITSTSNESTKSAAKSNKTIASQGNLLDNIGCAKDSRNSITVEHDITSTSSYGMKTMGKFCEDNYDSISEDKTSGSEYLPSSDEDLSESPCPLDCDIGTNHLTDNNSDNFVESPKKKKRKTKQGRHKVGVSPNTYARNCHPDLNEPYSSESKLNTRQTIHNRGFDLEEDKVKEDTFQRPSPKIKIVSNIQVKLPTKFNNRCSVTHVEPIIAPAESTTKDNETPVITNLVKISAPKQTTEGKRIRDKKHSCYYCNQLVLHIARHLEVKHETEMDVARALAYPKNSNKRKDLFSEITRAGDFHHNCEVLSLKQGELILVRRPTINEIHFNKYRDYGPCPNCLGFLLKKHLWHHLKTKCSKDPDNRC